MNLDDIISVDFSQSDIDASREWQTFMDVKNDGAKTDNLNPNKNMYGYLGHLAVEMVLSSQGVDFQSTRIVKYKQGDEYDLAIVNDRIDVKAHPRELDPKWFFNENLLVLEIDVEKYKKTGELTHFCFVRVKPDMTEGYVFGMIEWSRFLELAEPVTYKAPSYQIKSRQLTPILKYAATK